MLSIKNLHVSVKKTKILQGINLDIKNGELHVVMGPNGSGKSTLANILAGKQEYNIEKGTVDYFNENLLNMEVEDRASKGIFMSFQYPIEIPGINNAYFLRSAMNSQQKFNGEREINASEFMKKYKNNMSLLDLDSSFISRCLNEGFSGGEKKRNEMLQMLMLKPKLCILDETDSGLDIDALRIVAEGINQFRNARNALILVTHYQRILHYISPDYVHVLLDGRIVMSGDSELAKELEKKGYEWIPSNNGSL